MSDQEVVIESKAPPEVQARAIEMGWVGPDKYRGDPEKFVDADTFVERGETFIPFLKKERTALQQQLAEERAARQALEAQVKETSSAVEELRMEYTVEAQRRADAARKTLKEEIRAARKNGDFDRVDELTESIEELDEAEKEAKREAEKASLEKKKAPEAPKIDPEVTAWVSEHGWLNTDKRKAALFYGFCEARRADGDTSRGRTFFDAALKDMEDSLEGERPAKVASGKNGSGSGGGSGKKGKSYSDLPSEAKRACDDDARHFVGKGKKYSDKAAWQSAYAETYFRYED